MTVKEYDVVIIGGGAAGLTAAIYAARRMLNTLVVSKDIGGQALLASEIENYPGRDSVKGIVLINDFKKQAEKFGAEIVIEEVVKIENQEGSFLINTTNKNYKAKALILAFGLTPRDLEVPGETELKGKGVSYCATCDAPLFKNKTVVVVGGGSSALDAAELLSTIASKVYLIHRKDIFSGEEILQKRIKKIKNVEILFNTEVKEIRGKQFVSAIEIVNSRNKKKKEIKCNGIFIEIGYIAKTSLVEGLVGLNERRQIKVNRNCETSQPGIFSAGDVTDTAYKQIVISAGEGAKAALQAYKYLQQKRGKIVGVDWGKVTPVRKSVLSSGTKED